MAIIRCKMCGGELALIENQTVAECEYCGSRQTVPTMDNEKKLTLFARASRLRATCEFDKAAGIYETIVADFPEEAESYWGLVLCKYGIEYVDDPATGKKIPTCHRSSFESLLEDPDFEQTLENADALARRVYREEAKQIEQIRRGIIAVSANEEPYDIFICYKETDENGQRTLDSVLAQDIYDALTEKGYRTFFSRITLEDKLGQEYEPYIFAALNSAKIMLAVGTDYEYYNAVWVKNEWSRFLKLMAKDKTKYLIPCYKGIDAYDMPREFTKLQAQDLGKMGAIQDILRGVEKLLPRKVEIMKETVILQNSMEESPTEPLLRRAFLFLEDGNWSRADEYCEKVLDMAPESAAAYLGKLLAELRVHKKEDLVNCTSSFAANDHFRKALRFADPELRKQLEASSGYVAAVMETLKNSDIENGILKKYRGSQRRVVIPRSVTGIGKDAFRDCVSLRTIEIPHTATDIASGVFSGCVNLSEILLSEKNSGFRVAGTCLIDRNKKMVLFGTSFQDVPGDGSICRIGDRAFYGSGKLTEIQIPEGITHIGKEAFAGCENLRSVALPASVMSIASDAFPHNPEIRIHSGKDHPVFRTEGNCLIHKPEKTVVFGTDIRDLPKDESVTGIGENAFLGCKMPEDLEISENIKRIGANAFSGCGKITSITFLGRVLDIADNAFGWAGQNPVIYAFAGSDGARWAGRNGISSKENQEMKRISTAAFLDQGNVALKDGNWAKAGDFFKNALGNDAQNAAAYLGRALVQEQCHSLGALIRKHSEGYQHVSLQKLHLDEDTDHINEMAAKYTLPGYVDEKTIRDLYRFDLSYTSAVAGRQKQYADAVNWWENHRQLSRAEKYAAGDLAAELQQEKNSLLAQMEQRTQNARKDEAWNIHQVSTAYAAHLAKADQEAERIYQEGAALREKHYQTWQDQAQQETDPKKLRSLADSFTTLGDYRDSALLAETCRSRAVEEREKQAAEKEYRRAEAARRKKARRKRLRPVIAVVAVILAVCLVLTGPVAQLITDGAPQMAASARKVIESVPALQYVNARILAANGKYEAAAADFDALGDYKDAAQRGDEAAYLWAEELFAAEQYAKALAVLETIDTYEGSAERIAECEDRIEVLELVSLEATGKLRQAALGYYKRGQREKSLELWNLSADRETISVGTYHTVALRNDGTVAVTGSNWDHQKKTIAPNGQCDVSLWKNIVDLEAGNYHTVGLKSDGTVVATGQNTLGQCDVSTWTEIVAVAAGHGYSAGLRADGTVLVAGDSSVSSAADWTDMISLAGGDEYIIGLKADGTTMSTKPNVIASRENVAKVTAGIAYIFLHEDGSVSSPYSTFAGLKGIEDIFAGSAIAACRETDGSLQLNFLSVRSFWGTKDIDAFRNWSELQSTDIVALSVDVNHGVVLHSDGTLSAIGTNNAGQCNVSNWRNIKVPQQPVITFAEEDIQPEAEAVDYAAEYKKAENLLALGKTAEAAIAFGKLDGYEDARARSFALWDQVAVRKTVAVGNRHTLAVKNDGTVLATGKNTSPNPCEVGDWTDIVAVAATTAESFGLKSDGTVVTTGSADNELTRRNDIIAISDNGAIGLKMDGTVVSTVYRFDLSGWTDMMAVYYIPGGYQTPSMVVGVKTNGTFFVATPKGVTEEWEMPMEKWTDIVSFGAVVVDAMGFDGGMAVGLKANGRAVASKNNWDGQGNVGGWNNLVQVAVCGSSCSLGLMANGTVVMAGKYPDAYNTSGWRDIVSIATSKFHAVGLKSDGTLVATGQSTYDRCDVSDWSDIKLPNNYLDYAVPADYKPTELTGDAAAYQKAKDLMAAGETAKAALAFGKLGDYGDSREQSIALWDSLSGKQTISAGRIRTMAVQNNGNVLTTDGTRLSGGMAAVSDGNWHYVGLRTNGTVEGKTTNDLMAGLDGGTLYKHMQERNIVSTWKDIQSISAGDAHTVGLYVDGTAVAAGDNHYGRLEVGGWDDLIAVSAGYDHTVGLRSDGTVLSTGGNKDGLPDTSGWKDIKAVSAGKFFTVGLQKGGRVIATGNNEFGQCDVSDWSDVVAVSAGNTHTVALLRDGTVVAVGSNEYGQCNVNGWHDIVAIDAGYWHTVGLKSDGTLVAVGLSSEGRCDVGSWTNIKMPK